MSMSQYASFSDYKNGVEAANPRMAGKPTVEINNAGVVKWLGGSKRVLVGTPVNHPRDYLNGKEITSSSVVRVEGDIVETKNTIYKVLSWYKDGA